MHTSERPLSRLLTPGAEWKMEVDLERQLQFPQEICSTTLRPDVVLWAAAVKSVILIELTVPWEEGIFTLDMNVCQHIYSLLLLFIYFYSYGIQIQIYCMTCHHNYRVLGFF